MKIGLLAIALITASCFPSISGAQWYGSVDFMPLRRCDPKDTVFQRNQSLGLVGSSIVLGAEDVAFDFVFAGRVTIGNRLGGGVFGIEGSYMSTDTGKAAASAYSSNGLLASPFSEIGSLPDPVLDNNVSVRLDYRSRLQSAEVSLTQMVYDAENGDALLLLGVRAMALDESLDYVSNNAAHRNEFRAEVDNRLIGPQVGVLGRTPVPYGFLSARVKGALLWNTISEDVAVNGATGHADDGQGSLAGEVAFDYWFQPTPRLALRLGYQALGVTGVGLATENLAQTTAVSAVNTGGVIYHGPSMGLVFHY